MMIKTMPIATINMIDDDVKDDTEGVDEDNENDNKDKNDNDN